MGIGGKDEAEALFQELFNEVQGRISRALIPRSMGLIKEMHGGLYEVILNTEAEQRAYFE